MKIKVLNCYADGRQELVEEEVADSPEVPPEALIRPVGAPGTFPQGKA